MAKVLKKIFDPAIDEVFQNFTIHSWHVSQSVDAFTGDDDYDVTISGSLVVTGSVAIHTLPNSPQNGVVLYDDVTGLLYYTASNAFAVNNFYTSSITQSFTSSVVNNSVNNSTVNQTIVNSTVNQPAPSDQYIQYNSASTFGASPSFQYVYPSESFQQGSLTVAFGNYSHAQGKNTRSQGASSHAEGESTLSSGNMSHAEGHLTTASAYASHAEGYQSTASQPYSHAEGYNTVTNSPFSHAEGRQTQAAGSGSHAEGNTCTTTGDYSHAEGQQTFTIGGYSHAEGTYTTARGVGSHAEGYSTLSQGLYSHAEGQGTLTSGWYSHAEGAYTTSSVNYSHAEGYWTIADGLYQHVQGQFNRSSSAQSAFIVGNGTSNVSRSNLVFASGSTFQVTGSLNVSGSFSARYRNLGSVEVPAIGFGISVTSRDYNVVFTATTTAFGNVNKISLPPDVTIGTVIYLQRISGVSACQVSGSGGSTINGAAGFSFPTTVYTRRMFVYDGSNWFVEV
jgi:hypothetical protein